MFLLNCVHIVLCFHMCQINVTIFIHDKLHLPPCAKTPYVNNPSITQGWGILFMVSLLIYLLLQHPQCSVPDKQFNPGHRKVKKILTVQKIPT